MRNTLIVAVRFTLITTILLGIAYPLAITAFAHFTMPSQANGQLISHNGSIIGSRIIGQSFSSDRYFHSRPSAAGNGYDATASGGSNYAQSNKKLVDRIQGDVASLTKDGDDQPVPIDLVTASGSGLDPDISPASALYQVARIAKTRHLQEDEVRQLVTSHIQQRQFGVLGDPRVNVLELNLALDEAGAR